MENKESSWEALQRLIKRVHQGETPSRQVDYGEEVLCDFCNTSWKGRPESGGFLFSTYAVCPECAPRQLVKIKRHNEEHLILVRCPEDLSFWKWVLQLRAGNNVLKVYTASE